MNKNSKEYIYALREELGYNEKFKINSFIQNMINNLPDEDKILSQKIWERRELYSVGHMFDELMESYKWQLFPLLKKTERKIFDNIFWFIYPSGLFSGLTTLLDNGQRGILLNEGLVHSIAMITHWFISTLEKEKMKNPIRNLENEKKIASYLYNVWHSKTTTISEVPDIYPKSYLYWKYDEILCFGAILFIMGHEFAHILNNDSGYCDNKLKNHIKEYNADKFGLEIVIRYCMKTFITDSTDSVFCLMSLYSPYIALAAIELENPSETNNHPSSKMRINQIYRNYPSIIMKATEQKVDDFLEITCAEKKSLEIFNEINSHFLKKCGYIHEELKELKTKYGSNIITETKMKKYNLSYN